VILDKLLGRPRGAITDSGALAKLLGAGYESNSGVAVTPDSAMRSSAVYACVLVISETVAQLPFILYQRDGKRKDRAVSEKLYTLLHDAPNNFQTSFEWRQTKTAHLCLRGKAYSFINRSSSGEILELLPMHPDMVKLTQAKDYSLSYIFTDADGMQIPLKQNQVFRITGLSLDGVNGVSPLTYHRETIGIALAANKQSALSLKNGSKMSGILKHPGKLKDKDVAARIRESWDEAFGGDNAGKTALLEDGMDWMQVSMTNRDAQYIESQKFRVEDIARIYRVPPHKIGHLEKSTNNNIEHQGLEFVTDTMMPWFVRWEQCVARDLLTPDQRKRYFAEYLVDGLLRGDSESRGNLYMRMFTMGSMNPDEIRAKENMNPREDGKGGVYYVPSNMESALMGGKSEGNNNAT
jgi:HK97 family phage portal protein